MCLLLVASAIKRVNFRRKKNVLKNLLRNHEVLFIQVYDIILYINCVFCFVQVRTGCYGNFFHFVVIPGRYSSERL